MEVTYKVEDLIGEIKRLKECLKSISQDNVSLRHDLQSRESECRSLDTENQSLKKTVDNLQFERTQLITKSQNQIKKLETTIRRNDVFLTRPKEIPRTKKELMMVKDMNDIRRVNRILIEFVDALGNLYGFDSETLKTLAKIAEGVDDMLLKLFFRGIKNYPKRDPNGLPVGNIDFNRINNSILNTNCVRTQTPNEIVKEILSNTPVPPVINDLDRLKNEMAARKKEVKYRYVYVKDKEKSIKDPKSIEVVRDNSCESDFDYKKNKKKHKRSRESGKRSDSNAGSVVEEVFLDDASSHESGVKAKFIENNDNCASSDKIKLVKKDDGTSISKNLTSVPSSHFRIVSDLDAEEKDSDFSKFAK